MPNVGDVLHSEPIFGGTFEVVVRDISYGDRSDGRPNLEDPYLMQFKFGGQLFTIGSHPSLKGAVNGWLANHKTNEAKFWYSLGGMHGHTV